VTHTSPDIAALIGSRICHDLISPVGAISNGLELMTLSGVEAGPEFSLVDDSARGANARIRFFRVAFGKASDDQMVGAPELAGILEAIYTGPQRLDWQISEPLPRPLARMAFLALLCLERTIPRGGTLAVTGSPEALVLRAEAEALTIHGAHWDILQTGVVPDDLPPAQVQFPLLYAYAGEAGCTLRPEIGETSVRITLES